MRQPPHVTTGTGIQMNCAGLNWLGSHPKLVQKEQTQQGGKETVSHMKNVYTCTEI